MFNKTRTGAIRRGWPLKAVLSFHHFFIFATKFLCTAGEVAQSVGFSDGQYLYFSHFFILETLEFDLLKIMPCSPQLNFLRILLITEIITSMLNTSHQQAGFALDCPLKVNICLGIFLAFLGFSLLESHLDSSV